MCRLLQDEIGTVWEKRVFAGEWDAERAGGCGNTAAWKQNDQYWVRISGSEPVKMFFHLAQEDVRSQFKPIIEYSIGLYLMTHDSIVVKKTQRLKGEVRLLCADLSVDQFRRKHRLCTRPPSSIGASMPFRWTWRRAFTRCCRALLKRDSWRAFT